MKNKIFIILTLLASAIFLNSCLKDNVGEDWTSSLKGKMYAEVWQAGFRAMSLNPVPDSVDFKFLINIATDAVPTTDITVTIGVDTAAVTRYNALKGTNYKTYPFIDIPATNIVIKAGTRNAYAHVKVWNANTLNPCDNFMAPIAIVAADNGVVVTDALNQGARLMGLPIVNPWAGDYQCVGYRQHPTLGFFDVDQVETLSTINCSTVKKSGFGDYPYDVIIQISQTTMNVLGVACNKCTLTIIDPSTGVEVSSGQGQYATFTGTATHNPIPPSADVNYYNPVTKQFVLNAWYNSAANRIMYEILTRL